MSTQFGLGSFVKNVTTAGTREKLSATNLFTVQAAIMAKPGNTGIVYVGGDDVSSSNGWPLAAGVSVAANDLQKGEMMTDVNLALIWLDAATSGDGVIVLYSKQYTVED